MTYKEDFKIMQLTDLHFSVQSDFQINKNYLTKNIKKCRPDLIILTGDAFLDCSRSIVDKVLNFINSFNIPFAFTYGNHDLQGDYNYRYINDSLLNLKNSVLKDPTNDDVFGNANYFIDLTDSGATKYRLYIIDSNNYHFTGIKYGYDVIHDDQLNHIDKIVQEYGKVPSFAFYHIPLYEARDAYEAIKSGEKLAYKGVNNEKCSVGYKRTDAFERLKNDGVIGHFYGHDHINYTDIMYEGVTLSYGLKSTHEIYNNEDLLGYKTITLKSDMSYDLSNIETVVVPYE